MKLRTFKTQSGLASFLASRPAQAYDLRILHDRQCTPSACRCKPWFELRPLTVANHLEGVRLESEWRKAVAS